MPDALNRKRSLSLRGLTAFAEIMRTGSATAAAKILGLSQPGVSRLLQQVEDEIGFELFYRDRGRLVPTKDGLALAREVELALAGVARINSLVDDINGNAVGEIRLLAPPSFAEAVLPVIVAKFIQKFPGVRISVDSRSIATTKNMLATRVADCAFMRMPIEDEEFRAERFVTSRTICVVPADHALAKAQSLSPEMLVGVPLVALGTGFAYGSQIDEAFRARRCRRTIVVETHTTGSACALARQGIGIAIVNELLATAYLNSSVAVVSFEPAITHGYALVTSTHSPPSRLLTELRTVVFEHFGSNDTLDFS